MITKKGKLEGSYHIISASLDYPRDGETSEANTFQRSCRASPGRQPIRARTIIEGPSAYKTIHIYIYIVFTRLYVWVS